MERGRSKVHFEPKKMKIRQGVSEIELFEKIPKNTTIFENVPLEIDGNWPVDTFGSSRIEWCTRIYSGTPSF